MNREGKDKLIGIGTKVGASLFSLWMDSIARRRPRGLVARFRRRFGKLTVSDLEETIDSAVDVTKDLRKRK